MTIAVILESTRAALAGVLGADWQVHAADNEWSLLQLLGERPSGVRAVLLPDDFVPSGAHPKGLAGAQLGRLVVQIARGLAKDEAEPQSRLLAAEERARRALLSIVFQLPGDPDFTDAAWTATGSPPHPEVTGFRQTGTGAYKPPIADAMLEHPAREIRWSVFTALRLPDNILRVDIPIAAGN